MRIEIPLPWPVEINLSKPALEYIHDAVRHHFAHYPIEDDGSLECEVDNFRNLLLNLLERSEPKPENFDLIGG